MSASSSAPAITRLSRGIYRVGVARGGVIINFFNGDSRCSRCGRTNCRHAQMARAAWLGDCGRYLRRRGVYTVRKDAGRYRRDDSRRELLMREQPIQ